MKHSGHCHLSAYGTREAEDFTDKCAFEGEAKTTRLIYTLHENHFTDTEKLRNIPHFVGFHFHPVPAQAECYT